MQKVAIFGNAGGGKSTLSRRLAEITNLPLYTLDKIKFRAGGEEVPQAEFEQTHQAIIESQAWIMDGFGSLATLWPRLDAADTLIHVDLPLSRHFWWVTKRFISSYFVPPPGWPENSPLLKSSLSSYQALWLCHQRLTPKYRQYVTQARPDKEVYHLRTPAEMAEFLEQISQR